MSRFVIRLATVAALGFTSSGAQAQHPAPLDLLIRNGTVIDGTGRPMFRADVGIAGGRIVAVGNLAARKASDEIDADGLYVTPGFINLHSHASPAALATAVNMLTQGVTMELMNADGGGRADIAQQMEQAAAGGLALNVGAYIGFNAAWTSVVGETDRRPTPDEIDRMRGIITSNLDAGAWGVSAGLDYKPAYYATTEEVVEVVQAAAPYRTNFTNHDRITPESKYSSRAGMSETIGIGSRAGLVPVITHMKVQGHEQGSAAATLREMSEATRRGHYTAADVYPYLAGQTGLGALLIPGWAQDGGREKMLERFRDPSLRARIVAEAEEAMQARFGGANGVYLPNIKRELADVMREMNASPGETVIRLLEQDNQGAILRFGVEEDLVRIMQHPSASIACDCGASLEGRGAHPRNYGTYPRVLGHYVRERKVLTWENAVRKMTLLPASIIGLVDRGAIAVGMAADLTVFDPATVIDRATYEAPTQQSEGIRHVLVNGVVALREGAPTGARGGQVLRRQRYMPSRPINLEAAALRLVATGEVAWSGGGESMRVRLDVSQPRGARAARGRLRVVNKAGKAVVEAHDFGLIQTAGGWGSVTAVVRDSREPATASTNGGDYAGMRSAVIAVEQADPMRADRKGSITIVLDGSELAGTATVRVR